MILRPDIDRYPWDMSTQELYQQAEHIEALLGRYRPRLSLATLLISYAAEIQTTLYNRENRQSEPEELTTPQLHESLEHLLALSAFRPRRKVAVPLLDYQHALTRVLTDRENGTSQRCFRP